MPPRTTSANCSSGLRAAPSWTSSTRSWSETSVAARVRLNPLAIPWQSAPQAIRVALECVTVPAAQFGGGLIRGLQKAGDRIVRSIGGAHCFVGQHEFAEFVAEVCAAGFNSVLFETVRLGVGVGVERALLASSWPKATTAELP